MILANYLQDSNPRCKFLEEQTIKLEDYYSIIPINKIKHNPKICFNSNLQIKFKTMSPKLAIKFQDNLCLTQLINRLNKF